MAEITLRAYLQEIDDLIEHEHLDEAIAHSRHLLQTYPKHLETYRLLGKSYLEAKRYGDAADLFQRVLSAIPDDFVAHIGMSIVREDEGNLDASIWHMERAFETNPANPAIQQELRRLIGRRDGLEPHKVRLTRGALARMYAHGELYPQAIAELRSALQEDPDRPDLQTLLAEMYWRTEQRAEAAEVCTRILEKLPYCRDGLRILAAALHAAGQVDEAAVYHRRLASLDPYAAFLESATGDSKSVEAGAVKVEKLVWHPGQPLPSGEAGPRPQWTTGRPAAESASSPAAVPGWLSALEEPAPVVPVPAETPSSETIHPFAGAKPPEGGDIPDWMRQSGWAESTGAAMEGPVSYSDEEIAGLKTGQVTSPVGPEANLEPADIPDWLQQIAPAPGPKYPAEPSTRPSTTGPTDLPDWLGEFAIGQDIAANEPQGAAAAPPAPEPTRGAPSPGLFTQKERPASEVSAGPLPSEDVPSWLETPADGATATIVTWLGRKDSDSEGTGTSPPPSLPGKPPGQIPSEEEIPSWIGRMQSSGPSEPAEAARSDPEGLPAWLSGVAEAASQEDALTPAELESIRPPTSPLSEQISESEEEPPHPLPRAEAPDWLRAIASGDSAEGEIAPTAVHMEPPVKTTPTTPPERTPTEPPLPWKMPAGANEGGQAPPASDESEPEWLRGIGEPESPGATPAPDWLRGIADAAAVAGPSDGARALDPGLAPNESETPSEDELVPEPPDWLTGRATSVQPTSETMDVLPSASEAAEIPASPEGSLGTAAEPPAWLREFASPDEAIRAEEPLTPAEIPDWLREFGQKPPPSLVETGTPVPSDETPATEFQGALDWLQATASEVAPDPMQTPPPAAPAAPLPPDLGVAEPVPDDEVFRWLEDLASRQEVAPREIPEAEEPPTVEHATQAPVSPPYAEQPQATSVPTAPAAPPTPPRAPEIPVEPEAQDANEEWLREMAATASTGTPTDLWEKLESEEVTSSGRSMPVEETRTAVEPAPVAQAIPAPDETLPGTPRSGLAGPRRPTTEPEQFPQTTPLTEGEVVEWLRQTARASKSSPVADTGLKPEPKEELTIPEESDQGTSLAIQLVQAARAALLEGDVPAALQAYAPVIERGYLLNSVIEDLKKAVETRPDSTVLWQALGDAYKKANMLPEAIKAFSRAMKQEDGLESARRALEAGDFALAVMHYGGLINKKRDLELVIGDLRRALDRDPRRPSLWQALGDACMKANRLPEAIEAYRRGMESI